MFCRGTLPLHESARHMSDHEPTKRHEQTKIISGADKLTPSTSSKKHAESTNFGNLTESTIRTLRKIWKVGRILGHEMGGVVAPNGDIIDVIVGDESDIANGYVFPQHGIKFHTHPVDIKYISPPKINDYHYVMRLRKQIGLVVDKEGIWYITSKKRIKNTDFDAVTAYINLLNENYTKEGLAIEEYITLINRFDPKNLLIQNKIIENQILTKLKYYQEFLQGKQYVQIEFLPFNDEKEMTTKSVEYCNILGRSI